MAAGAFKQDVTNTPLLPPPPAATSSDPPLPLTPPTPDSLSAGGQAMVPHNREMERMVKELRAILTRLAEAEKTVKEKTVKETAYAEELERAVASMQKRYTKDYPDLLAAQAQLAALSRAREEFAQAAPAEQKPEEHTGPSYIDSHESVG